MKAKKVIKLAGIEKHNRNIFKDSRGSFSKPFICNGAVFAQRKLAIAETYYSVSHKNIVRGLHYQTRPFDCDKIISVIQGKVLDYVLCVDPNSPEFGQYIEIEISDKSEFSILINKGYAHGFKSLADNTIMLYQTTAVYSQIHDHGVHFSCIEELAIDCKLAMSDRDKQFPSLGKHNF